MVSNDNILYQNDFKMIYEMNQNRSINDQNLSLLRGFFLEKRHKQ
jgi:hypothetical protein